MKTLSIILSSLSAIAVILAILYEGKLKVKKNNKPSNLTKSGWLLIIISVLVSLGNGISTSIGIADSEDKYEEEKVRYNDLRNLSNLTISELQKQGKNDSIRISQLEQITKEIGDKSDSIRIAVVDNAVRALDEQQKIIERQRQNAFINLKNESNYNLETLSSHYSEDEIDSFIETNYSLTNELRNDYLYKYQEISNNSDLNTVLIYLSQEIGGFNDYIHRIPNLYEETRTLEIKAFKNYTSTCKLKLIQFNNEINKYESYKDFEKHPFHQNLRSGAEN